MWQGSWGSLGYLLIKHAKNKYDFNIVENTNKMKVWQWIVIIILIALSFFISYNNWNGFKLAIEYKNNGLIPFILQIIYYGFEIFLVSLIIVFGQKACELGFGNDKIPYVGILLALTWGIVHILTKGSVMVGLVSMIIAFMFGSIYLLCNKNFFKSALIIFIMFIL